MKTNDKLLQRERREKNNNNTSTQHSLLCDKYTEYFVVLECTEVFAELCVKDKML